MNTKFISNRALSVIDQYLNFKAGNAVCSVPYFNNKTVKARVALRTYIGKGSPRDIFEEIQALAVKNHLDIGAFSDESLKRLLVDNNIGIECSGFAYYVLNVESEERGKGAIDRHLSFVNCHGFIGKMRCRLRPTENCGVATFADDKNSYVVSVKDTQPGDIITITVISDADSFKSKTFSEIKNKQIQRGGGDHILVIHQIEYQNFVPLIIHYSHAIAYSTDGIYGNGIRQGQIDVLYPDKPITEAVWTESGKVGNANILFVRAQKSKTEVRRLKWF